MVQADLGLTIILFLPPPWYLDYRNCTFAFGLLKAILKAKMKQKVNVTY